MEYGKTIETENKDDSAQNKTCGLLRTAKAAYLVSSIKNRLIDSSIKLNQQKEEMKLRCENENLKTKLLLERVKNRRIKLCGYTKFLLNLVVFFGFWLFCLFIVYIF